MLERLRTEKAMVQMKLVQYDSDGKGATPVGLRKGGVALARPNDFLCLRTKVTNLSSQSLWPFFMVWLIFILRLGTPLALTMNLMMEPMEHIISEGVLSDIPLGRLGCGESTEVETGVCFLSLGRFQIDAEIRCVGSGSGDSAAGLGQLGAVVRDEG